MIYAVYVPLLLPLLVAPFARPVSRRCRPSVAAPTLAAVAVVLAACSTVSFVLLAATHWPDFGLVAAERRLPAGLNPADPPLAAAAAVVAVVAVGAATVTALGRISALRAARRRFDGRPRDGDAVPVTVLDSPRPEAFSLPAGRRSSGTIVVSTGMLDGLDDDERAVLLAHERSHVVRRHHRLIALARAAALLHPALWPMPGAVRFAAERCADEDAAAATGDRRGSARAVGRAALLARDHERGGRGPAVALGVAPSAPRDAGAVPRRVAALLAPPPEEGRWVVAVGAAVAFLSVVAAAEGVRDLGHLLALWSKI